MSRRVECLVCDFGGVLTTPLAGAFVAWQQEHGVPLESLGRAMAAAGERHGENPLYDLERGSLSWADFLVLVEDALEHEAGRRVSMEGFAERYFALLQPNEELIAHLRTLRDERGLRLAMLTNNVREWEPRWRALLPVDELFELVVDSAFVGSRKPEPEIYALTLERLGLPAEACAFLDDIDVNVAAARDAGMAAIRFETTTQAIADLDAVLG